MNGRIGAVIVGALCFAIWAMLFVPAHDGWGYYGHNGYHSGSSFWYFGGSREYPSNSTVRTGSRGGPNNVGRGPGVGK